MAVIMAVVLCDPKPGDLKTSIWPAAGLATATQQAFLL
jgi:hypothetical protein